MNNKLNEEDNKIENYITKPYNVDKIEKQPEDNIVNKLFAKLLRNNHKNTINNLKSEYLNLKTSENITGEILNTYCSEDVLYSKTKDNINLNFQRNNFKFSKVFIGKNNNNMEKDFLNLTKCRKVKDRIKRTSNGDKIENIPLWIEKENEDLDFSVNTICYDKTVDKFNSLPDNYDNDLKKDAKSDYFYNKNKFNLSIKGKIFYFIY